MQYVIIGSGAAGVFAAKKIRQRDNDGEITIFTDDMRPLFSKPRLPELLAGDCSEKDLETYKLDWYAKQHIQIRTETAAKGIVPGEKVVVTADNTRHAYDKLLIATGSHPARLPINGFDGDHVYTVRTIDDVITLRSVAKTKKNCIVLGGGLLGIEIGYALSKLGISVTVVEYFNRLIPRQLDEEGSQLLKEVLQNQGLQFILGVQPTAIEDHSGKKQLVLKGRDALSCDFMVMSVGISPSVQLARDAGLNTHKGIIADDFLRTSHADIFTAGDCAEHNGIIYGLWSAAMEQGEIAGENMAGASRKYLGTTVSTQLKVAGIEVASVGAIEHDEKAVNVIKKTDAKSACYKKIFLKDKQVLGAIMIGCNKDALKTKQLIKDRTVIENPESLL
jgi:nitrite reductase (NADH) large subunit